MENLHTDCEDKKTIRSKTLDQTSIIWNQDTQILTTYSPVLISWSTSATQHLKCSNGFVSTSEGMQVLQ